MVFTWKENQEDYEMSLDTDVIPDIGKFDDECPNCGEDLDDCDCE